MSGNCKFCTILEPPHLGLLPAMNWVRKGMLRLSLKSIFRSTDIDDFRGISVTPVIARAFERTVYNIFNRRDIASRLGANQFAYKTGGSYTNALVKMQHDISRALDNPRNKAVRLFTMDLSKAFDNVNHHLLAEKQKISPMSPHIVKLYGSLLSGRKQRLVQRGTVCDWMYGQ